MTEQTTPATETVEKKRSVWKPLAAAGIGGAVLVATGFGVFAQLQATANNTVAQAVNTGDLKLVMAPDAITGGTSAGFVTGINNMAPGDAVNRFVSLTNSGSLDGLASSLKLKVTDSVGSLLSTDALHGLQLKVQECQGTWTAALTTPNPTPFAGTPTAGAAPTCSGTMSTALTTNLAAFTGTGAPQTVPVKSTAAGSVNHLLVTLSVPDQNEVTVNGGTPSPVAANAAGGFTGIAGASTSIQRLSAALTFTFSEFQRDGVASNS